MQHPVVCADKDDALLFLACSISAGSAIGVLSAGLGAERSAIVAIQVIGLNLGRRIDDVPHFPHIFRAASARAIRVRVARGPVGAEAYSPVPAATNVAQVVYGESVLQSLFELQV